jgi:hypothetical protein
MPFRTASYVRLAAETARQAKQFRTGRRVRFANQHSGSAQVPDLAGFLAGDVTLRFEERVTNESLARAKGNSPES